MMKRFFSMLLILFVLLAVAAFAETNNSLADEAYYQSKLYLNTSEHIFVPYDEAVYERIANEPRYILPSTWHYNSDGKVVDPGGTAYISIFDDACIEKLSICDWGYADTEYMEKYLRIDGNTAEMGDNRVSIVLLAGVAAISLAGFFYAGRKAHHAK